MKMPRLLTLAIVTAIALSACTTPKPILNEPAAPYEPQVVAVVGDFGVGDKHEKAVAKLVAGYHPAFVVTVGDNVYKKGKSYENLVGKYYPQTLVPATGNHDHLLNISRFDSYFGTTKETRNYVYHAASGVDFFILDSDAGVNSKAELDKQWTWLVDGVSKSKANYQVVVLHHPPFSSSSKHGSTKRYQWAFRSMGVDLVLSGHDHTYERLEIDGLNYVVDGTGGAKLYKCKKTLVEGSTGCIDKHFGALFLYASKYQLRGVFRNTKDKVLDTFIIWPNQ